MNTEINLLEVKLVIQPIYNEASHRPLVSNINTEMTNTLYELTDSGSNITRESVSPIASNIIMPSTASMGTRNIVGGWSERRLAGYLLFEIRTPAEVRHEVLTVYTDKFDVTHKGTLADDTLFTIDNRKVISSNRQTGIINQVTGGASKDQMILRPVDVIAHDDIETKNVLCRPADVMGAAQCINRGINVIDTRSKVGVTGENANSLDSDSSTYIAKTLNHYRGSARSNEVEDFGFGVESSIYDGALVTLKSEHAGESQIVTLLKNRSQYGQCGHVSWGELISNFDRVGDRLSSISETHGVTMGPMEDVTSDSKNWHGADRNTNLAFRINDKIGKEMSNRLLNECSFIIKQDTYGRPDVQAYNVSAMFKQMSKEHVMRAVDDLCNVLSIELISVANTYADSYMLDVKATAFVNNRYEISLDGNNVETFIAPSFCTALMSSMVSDSEEALQDLGSTINGIIDSTFNRDNSPVIQTSGLAMNNVTGYNNAIPAHLTEDSPVTTSDAGIITGTSGKTLHF